jgi:hypothetical protein
MDLFLTLGLPIIVIVGFLRLLKVKWPVAILLIFGLTAFSTFIVDFTYCEILKTKCETDALNAVGIFFHWVIMSIISSFLDFTLYKLLVEKSNRLLAKKL